MLELEESDESGNDSSESEDDFEGYLDEEDFLSSDDQQSSEEDEGSDRPSSSEEEQESEDMDMDIPSIPPYTLQPGSSAAINADSSPIDYFSLFVDSAMLAYMVEQTNLFAEQYMASHTLAPHSRIRRWLKEEHTISELEKFLSLILVMGIVRYPQIESHWSTSWPYATDAFSSVSCISVT